MDDDRWLGPPAPSPPVRCRCGVVTERTIATTILHRQGNRLNAVVEGECEWCRKDAEAGKLRTLIENENVFPHLRAEYAVRLRKLERELKGRVA